MISIDTHLLIKGGDGMKKITVADCLELKEKFQKYCETAEQHEFALLAMVNIKMDTTIAQIQAAQKVENQTDTRAMFRVVLRLIGEDFSEYDEKGR